jgi:hypothetical protein
MDGIICILNQTRMALAQGQAEITQLNAEIAQLKKAPNQHAGN